MQKVSGAGSDLLAQQQDIWDRVAKAGGFVPESFYIMARKPKMLRAVTDLSMAVLLDEGEVDKGLRWLVGHVASRTAGCRYCWAHTGNNAVALAGVDPAKVEAVWEFATSPLFDEAERAALALAAAAAAVPNEVTEEHFAAARRHFDDDQIVEIVAVVALFGWFNRWNDTMATKLESEPLSFGHTHLAASGWDVGRHADDAATG